MQFLNKKTPSPNYTSLIVTNAINLLIEYWKQVKSECIQNCFIHCGFKNSISTQIREDPVEGDSELHKLLTHLNIPDVSEDDLAFENNLLTEDTYDGDNFADEILKMSSKTSLLIYWELIVKILKKPMNTI